MAVFRPSTGAWYFLRSSANYASWVGVQWGQSGDIAVPGDWDGDGRADMAVFRPSTGAWYFLKSSANYSNASWVGVQFGQNADIPIPR
jgi:hypothetical protein